LGSFKDNSFANTALIFDREGKIAGKYQKTHAAVDHYEGNPPWSKPPSGKDENWFLTKDPEWIMKKGDDLPVFDFDFGKVGIMTCYDGWFPECPRVMSLKGAELIVWINGRGGSVEDYIMKATMFQSHVAMISTNQAYGGGTMIGDCIQWPPRIIERAPDKKESYITAAVDLKTVRKIRETSRNFQQRRPELYRELVKEKGR
jgi:predicted amidohydrolase